MDILLKILGYFKLFLIIFIILLIGYCILKYIIQKKHLNVLEWDCDPERYLELIDIEAKKLNDRGKNTIGVNRAVAYICLLDFNKALEYMKSVNVEFIPKNTQQYLIYIIDLIICYYGTGEMKKADELFETELVKLCPYNKKLKKSIEILIGERYFIQGNYEASYKQLSKFLDFDLTKRQHLTILYFLAQMDEKNGENEKAIEKYKKIARLGNKLGIANIAREKLNLQ